MAFTCNINLKHSRFNSLMLSTIYFFAISVIIPILLLRIYKNHMFKHLSVSELKSKPLTDYTIVDIRDPASFASGSIEGSTLLNNQNIEQFIATANFEKPLVVCCYHGNSSQGAADYLSQQGFAEVFSLDGGYSQWAIENS